MLFKNKIIFIPNGIGDLVMLHPSLTRLISEHNNDITLILKDKFHASVLDYCCGNIHFSPMSTKSLFQIVTFFLKLWIEFFICIKRKCIYLPLVPKSTLNYWFFKLQPHRTYFSREYGWTGKNSIQLTDTNLHQVNKMISFFSRANFLKNGTNIIKNEFCLNRKSRISPKENLIVCVGFTCGNEELHKIPSTDYFAKLINKLNDLYNPMFYLPGISSENEKFDKLISKFDKKVRYKLILDNNFKDLIEEISNCHIGIAGTNGLGHILSLIGVPQVTIAGVADASISGPFCNNRVVNLNFACRFCYHYEFRFGCGQKDCMDSVSIEHLTESFKEIYGTYI